MLLNGVFGHLKLVLLLVAHMGLAGAANVLAQTQSVSTASSRSSSFGATATGTHGYKSSSHKKKKLGKGPIGGIAAAIILFIILVVVALLYLVYKYRKRREALSSAPVLLQSAPVSSIDEKDSITPQSPAPQGATYQPQPPQSLPIPNYQQGVPGCNTGYLYA